MIKKEKSVYWVFAMTVRLLEENRGLIIVRCIKYKNIWIFIDKTISYCKICGMFSMNT